MVRWTHNATNAYQNHSSYGDRFFRKGNYYHFLGDSQKYKNYFNNFLKLFIDVINIALILNLNQF